MSRTLSSLATQALLAQETGEVFLLLLTISGPGITTIRVVNNMENVVSNGQTYAAFPFQLTLPDDEEQAPPRLQLTIDNVDQQIIQALRSLTSPPSITLEIVLASQPNTVEATFPGFTLTSTTYDALTIEGELTMEDILNEPFPALTFTPNVFPGLF